MKTICFSFRAALVALACCAPARAEGDKPAAPARVLIVGDSMMRVTAHAIERRIDRIDDASSLAYTSLGSGLARLDVFDWMGKIDELVADFNPDATLVWFGANDCQALRTEAGILQPGAPGWEVEYAGRVGKVMDKLTAAPGARVLWFELPDMREAKLQEDSNLINRIVAAEAAKRDNVEFWPIRALLSRKPGKFSPYIIGPNGMPLQVRDSDGVHLNRAGADRTADAVIDNLFGGGATPKGR